MQTDLDDSLEQTIVCNNNKLILSTVEFVSTEFVQYRE